MKKIITSLCILALFASTYAQEDNCLSFNATGKNYVSIPVNESTKINSTGYYTIEFWIKPVGIPTDGTSTLKQGIVSKFNGGVEDYYVNLRYSNASNIQLQFNGATDKNAGGVIKTDQWQHIVCAFNQDAARKWDLYINGVLQTVENTPKTLAVKDNILAIGNLNGSQFFNGLIDDVALWNRVLSADEALRHYTNGIDPSSETGLVVYYNFNQGVAGGDNTFETVATTAVNHPDLDGTLTNFTLSGATSNWVEAGVKTGVEELRMSNLCNIYTSKGKIHIFPQPEGINQTINVFTVAGAQIYTSNLSGSQIELAIQKGVYVVRVGKAAQKLVVF